MSLYDLMISSLMNKRDFSDMWAVGAILAELFTLSPPFPGEKYVLTFTFCSINIEITFKGSLLLILLILW
jgi:serine/threonine protein kinase